MCSQGRIQVCHLDVQRWDEESQKKVQRKAMKMMKVGEPLLQGKNHRMASIGSDFKDSLFPNPVPWAQLPIASSSTRSGCPGLC